MMSNNYIPEAGDIVKVDLSPTQGHEQSGYRPALVLSHKAVHQKTGMAIICPITSKPKYQSYEVLYQGDKSSGSILILHPRSIDIHKRQIKFIERASRQTLLKTRHAVGLLIGLD